MECDVLKDELMSHKRGFSNSVLGGIAADGFSRSTGSLNRALPPLASRSVVHRSGRIGINNVSVSSSLLPTNQLPPLPIENEYIDDDDLVLSDDVRDDDSISPSLLTRALTPTLSVKDTVIPPAAAPKPSLLTSTQPPPAASAKESLKPVAQEPPVHRSVLLDVDLGQGQKDSILIHQDSDPMVSQ